MAKPTTKQIEACHKMGMSDEEIMEMYADDEDVDKGIAQEWDLTPEQHKAAMKNANADEHKKSKTATKRERKPNETKGDLIAKIAEFMVNNAENVVITNAERMISFEKDGKKFEITLIQKREPKK